MFVSSYYFRAHTYTMVPRHVREDMQWMAGVGTDAVVVGVLEQDLGAAVENYSVICAEAHRAGLKVFATPSRWGGLVAGCPKVPSIFSATRHEAWARKPDGSPRMGQFGPIASVHHPATFEFFSSSLRRLFAQHPIEGIVWDELKTLGQTDHSEAALSVLGSERIADPAAHVDATAAFFDKLGAEILSIRPDCRIGMFLYATMVGEAASRCAAITNLHDFGCDGRPFRAEDNGSSDSGDFAAEKLLCETGPWFVSKARHQGKRPLLLIENHAMSEADVRIMDRRLPEVFEIAGADAHVLYYYYPRSLENPDLTMDVIAKHFRKARGR